MKNEKKFYCAFCGEKNSFESELCKKCKRELHPEEHPWKDHILDALGDDAIGRVKDKTIDIVVEYIKTHWYGILVSLSLVFSATVGIATINGNEKVETVDEKPKIVTGSRELSLDSALVQRIYNYTVLHKKAPGKTYIYTNRYVDYETNHNSLNLSNAFRYNDTVLKDEIEVTSCDTLKGYKEIYSTCLTGYYVLEETDGYKYKFYEADYKGFASTYHEMYGLDKVIPKEMFNPASQIACEINEDREDMLCYSEQVAWTDDTEIATKLIKAIKDDNKIALYDYVLYMFPQSDGKKRVYSSLYTSNPLAEDYSEDLFEKSQAYKHTFQKDINGNYYWLSSEPIDSIPE